MATFRLAIIGGGFTGAIFAVHFLRAFSGRADITLFEPRETLGAGVAYGTDSRQFRINVPSDKMFVFAEDPDHFARWMWAEGNDTADPDGFTAAGDHYSLRHDFGAYMDALLRESAEEKDARLLHRRVPAELVERRADGTFHITDSSGEKIEADAVLVSASHAAPGFPWPLEDGAADLPGLVVNPWAPDAYRDIPPDGDVLVIGTGLSMADVVVSLDAAGHTGRITALSRRGLVPAEQGEFDSDFDLFGKDDPPRTAVALLRHLRERARDLAAAGRQWFPAIDALRRALPSYWSTLPIPERARLLRHLRTYWDVHRYRMAPKVHDRLARDQASGRLTIAAGRIERIGREGDLFAVDWRPRRSDRSVAPLRLRVAGIINCTGPAANPARSPVPLFRNLVATGLARPDPLGIGLDVAPDGTALGADGRPVPHLLVAGPLARGRFGETMGVPDASANARLVAEALVRDLASAPSAKAPATAAP